MKNLFIALILAVSASAASAEPVAQKDHGKWATDSGTNPAYWEEIAVWIDVLVENLSPEKRVGIVWTDNNWTTSQVTEFAYEYTRADGLEQWGYDFNPMGRRDSYYMGGWTSYITGTIRTGGTTLQYAVFIEANGVTYWDNNNGENYKIQL